MNKDSFTWIQQEANVLLLHQILYSLSLGKALSCTNLSSRVEAMQGKDWSHLRLVEVACLLNVIWRKKTNCLSQEQCPH